MSLSRDHPATSAFVFLEEMAGSGKAAAALIRLNARLLRDAEADRAELLEDAVPQTTAEALHVVCPDCDTLNRVPPQKLAAGGRCGHCREALFEGRPVALDTARFRRHLEKSDIPLLVDFWAA